MFSQAVHFLMVIGALASAAHGSALRKLQDFDWAITDGNWTVAFADGGGNELTGVYGIPSGKDAFSEELYQEDCSTALGDNPGVTLSGAPVASDDQLTVNLDLVQAALTNDNVMVADNGDNTISIKFCYRVDILLQTGGESINFHETKFDITVDLSQGFTVDAITTVRNEASQETENTEVNYALTASLVVVDDTVMNLAATDAWVAETGNYNNGASVGIAVSFASATSGVSLADCTSVMVGETDVASASYGGGALFAKDCGDTFRVDGSTSQSACVMRFLLVSSYFDEPGEQTVPVSGTCVLAFGRRLATRELQGNSGTSQFDLSIDLEGPGANAEMDEESGASVVVSTTMGASFMAVLIGSALFFM
mmetsp:Transcript_15659/g.24361  ORF Transcript_15659/g.24361 Transcript_15659/m.24361 type:complete len:367 (-) Transcript_15659:346-1446(-)